MVIPSGGCHRHIRRELLLCAISVTAESSRTDWVPNSVYATPISVVSMIGPGVTGNPVGNYQMFSLSLCCVMDFGSAVRAAQGTRVIVNISPWLLVDSRVALSTSVTTTFRSGASTKRIIPSR